MKMEQHGEIIEAGWLKDHHIRHIMTGTITFIACVIMDIVIVEHRHQFDKQPVTSPVDMTINNNVFSIALHHDGTITWMKPISPPVVENTDTNKNK